MCLKLIPITTLFNGARGLDQKLPPHTRRLVFWSDPDVRYAKPFPVNKLLVVESSLFAFVIIYVHLSAASSA